ncbi:A disintegrin and metallopeptidase domain 3-like [Phyllostomus hastatus]|uniref:A disintegrin and metallopeptidase domain 3-like n=1 Tax=Phyllostomus hastatus TaxID=9423 RepID=UPI001E67E6F3|nr:A disintegrin and metallopeptidase domain 3-like [Phyllostomus hastatus]
MEKAEITPPASVAETINATSCVMAGVHSVQVRMRTVQPLYQKDMMWTLTVAKNFIYKSLLLEESGFTASGDPVTYAIKIDGKTYTLHLEKQSFLDPHFLVYSYNKSGTLYPDSSFTKGHCYYQGYAAEIPKSAVTLSTCSGLRGLLQLENVSYGIEPLESAAMYEHILYQIKNNEIDFFSLQENDSTIQTANQPYKILVKSEKKSDFVPLKKTLKIQIIMDKALYDYMGSEVAVAVEKVVHIIGLINTMFSQLKVTFMLTSLELWSDESKILSDGDANEVLQRFVSWKEKFLFQRSRDMAFLLIYRNYSNYVGATYYGMVCDPKLAAGIALYPDRITSEAFSVVMAQLLAISLGITYDDIYTCYCPGATCIMNPQAIHSHGVKSFSSCSVDAFKHKVSQPELKCLRNQTVSKLVIQGRQATCGNGVIETGEQCDCGFPETCTFKKCCDPASCTLIGTAECGSGPCCDKNSCLIRPKGTICRISTDPCDFSEYCSGMSEFCVPDMKAADLEPCSNKTTYCFGGKCQEPDRYCMELFGKFAKGGDYLCLQEVNIHGDSFGNCRGMCEFGNTLCGKLVCHWMHTHIVIPLGAYDMQYTYYAGHVCISANMRNPAPETKTYVGDGTACGYEMFCHGRVCKPVSNYNNPVTCNSTEKCQGHGICNTRGNCQCDYGYAPPRCSSSPSSPGGSVDDGFWLFSEVSLGFTKMCFSLNLSCLGCRDY